jgi:hypothetical protein
LHKILPYEVLIEKNHHSLVPLTVNALHCQQRAHRRENAVVGTTNCIVIPSFNQSIPCIKKNPFRFLNSIGGENNIKRRFQIRISAIMFFV